MTLDQQTYIPLPSYSEGSFSDEGYAENSFHTSRAKPRRRNLKLKTQETPHEYCEHTEIADWESEGGANPDGARALSRSRNRGLIDQITTAETLLEDGDYDAAFSELKSAAERFLDYKDKIQGSFNHSISRLSTQGGPASPPHPHALHLIRLRRQLTA